MDFEAANEAFLSWLVSQKHVIVNPKIGLEDLRESNAGRGVVALAPLDNDEVLFKMPRTSVLSVDRSELIKLLPDELASLDSWLALILVLLYETRAGSEWKPYIDLLPRAFDSLMFWSDEELAELKGSAVLEKIGKTDAEETFENKLWHIVEKHPDIFKDTEVFQNGSYEPKAHFISLAHRMASIVMSYSFDLDKLDEDQVMQDENEEASDSDEEEQQTFKAMVPMADLFNANANKNNCKLFQMPDHLEMRTITSVEAGEELFNDYGPLPRSDLLRRYGYITEEYQQYDVVELPAPLLTDIAGREIHDEADRKTRIDYLLDEGVLDDSFDLTNDLEISPEILVTLHTLLLSSEDFSALRSADKLPKPKKTLKAQEVLLEVLEKRLADYETTIEEDEGILKDRGLQGRKRMAVEVRLGEKKILRGALECVKAWSFEATSSKRAGAAGSGGGGGKKARVR